MLKDNYECDGQLSIFDFPLSNEMNDIKNIESHLSTHENKSSPKAQKPRGCRARKHFDKKHGWCGYDIDKCHRKDCTYKLPLDHIDTLENCKDCYWNKNKYDTSKFVDCTWNIYQPQIYPTDMCDRWMPANDLYECCYTCEYSNCFYYHGDEANPEETPDIYCLLEEHTKQKITNRHCRWYDSVAKCGTGTWHRQHEYDVCDSWKANKFFRGNLERRIYE